MEVGQNGFCSILRQVPWTRELLEDLERDLAPVPEIVGQVDRGHPTLTELALDAVAAFEGRVQAGDGIGH